MKIEGNDLQGMQPILQPLRPDAIVQRQFERLLNQGPETRLVKDGQQAPVSDGLLAGAIPEARRDELWQLYLRGGDGALAIGKQLSAPVMNKLVERFGERQLPLISSIDLPELRGMMREFDPLASRREKVLLNLLSELRDGQGAVPAEHQFLDALARREQMFLMSQKAMVDNLVRNTHKLDLED